MLSGEVLTKEIAKISGDDVFLMFSRGKDSICCFYELKKHFKRIHLIHLYSHPDISFEKDSIKYFEDKFGQKIHNMPHPRIFDFLRNGLFQTPQMAVIMEVVKMPKLDFKKMYQYLREDFNLPNAFFATGVRMNDGPIRRMSIKVNGAMNKNLKTFYPIYDWTNDMIRDCLKENNVKLPIDYDLFGKSFDGLDYRFIKPLKEHFPADFEKLKELYPLIELEIMRYDNIKI